MISKLLSLKIADITLLDMVEDLRKIFENFLGIVRMIFLYALTFIEPAHASNPGVNYTYDRIIVLSKERFIC